MIRVTRGPRELRFAGMYQGRPELPMRTIAPGVWTASPRDEEYLRAAFEGESVEWPGCPPVRPEPPLQWGDLTLYPYQAELLRRGWDRALLGDDPGLGKTVQALIWQQAPTVIVCGASVKDQWKMEARRLGLQADPVWSRAEAAAWNVRTSAQISIFNYELLNKMSVQQFDGVRSVVLDECHAIKSRDAERTTAVTLLFDGVPRRLLLSATPVRNHTRDLWTQLRFLDEDRFGDWLSFASRYCGPKLVRIGVETRTQYDGTSNADELRLRLRSLYLARRKHEVGLQLPPKTRTIIPVELSNRGQYDRLESRLMAHRRALLKRFGSWDAVPATEKGRWLGAINSLRRVAETGKPAMAVDWAATRGEEPLVFFTAFVEPAKDLATLLLDRFDRPCYLTTGETPPGERRHQVEEFERTGGFFVITLGTGGQSLNLQMAAATSCLLSLEWTSAAVQQAEDRVHRIGQTLPVEIVFLTARTSIEDRVVRRLIAKADRSPFLSDELTSVFEEIAEAPT
jgi:SWI/SNF-related matrix-associated actin-dependent regulator of chromatin subfamily A-like protein 1